MEKYTNVSRSKPVQLNPHEFAFKGLRTANTTIRETSEGTYKSLLAHAFAVFFVIPTFVDFGFEDGV